MSQRYNMTQRLAPSVAEELEWTYLLHETLVGERCIVPLLDDVANMSSAHDRLKRVLLRQMAEETAHVELYEGLIGKPLIGDSYTPALAAYVRDLPGVTRKLFALQAVLESISLAAISHRLESVLSHPARSLDELILADEEGHVRFGYAFLEDLKAQDGELKATDFRRIAHEVNAIFARHFNGAAVAEFMHRNHGVKRLGAAEIDGSVGMKAFRRRSAQSIVEQSREFIARYAPAEVTRA